MNQLLIGIVGLLALLALVEYLRGELPVPRPLLLAILVVSFGLAVPLAALVGAAGTTIGRIGLALRARRQAGGSGLAGMAMGGAVAAHPRFATLTFLMGVLPLAPARLVFPTLGRLRAPLRYAVLGSLVGQWPLLAVMTAIVAGLARLVSNGNREAGTLLAIGAVAWMVIGAIQRIDWEHWRTARRLRFTPRQRAGGVRFGIGGFGAADGHGADDLWSTLMGGDRGLGWSTGTDAPAGPRTPQGPSSTGEADDVIEGTAVEEPDEDPPAGPRAR